MDARRIRFLQWAAIAVIVVGVVLGMAIASASEVWQTGTAGLDGAPATITRSTTYPRIGDGVAVMVGSLVIATALWCVALAKRTAGPGVASSSAHLGGPSI